eukprot:2508-Eustigmatos_ZCMA.PRE.1
MCGVVRSARHPLGRLLWRLAPESVQHNWREARTCPASHGNLCCTDSPLLPLAQLSHPYDSSETTAP